MINALVIREQGVPIGTVIEVQDITVRKRAEEALRESEEKYRNTMDAGLFGIYVIQDLVFRYVNPKMAEMFGYQVSELEHKLSPVDLVVPELRKRIRSNLKRPSSWYRPQFEEKKFNPFKGETIEDHHDAGRHEQPSPDELKERWVDGRK